MDTAINRWTLDWEARNGSLGTSGLPAYEVIRRRDKYTSEREAFRNQLYQYRFGTNAPGGNIPNSG